MRIQRAATTSTPVRRTRPIRLGPSIRHGWWFGTGNVGETAWNVSPFAYQLHKAKYVNPETGAESAILMVPSDDIQSYKAGYSGWQQGLIDANISPYATDPARPCIVMPSTDGDNAWGGGSSSWDGDAPSLMNNGTYPGVAVQDFVNDTAGPPTPCTWRTAPGSSRRSDYGSPYFLKWVEPPANPNSANRVYRTPKSTSKTPGFTPKFYSWAPVMAGANWCETAEQMLDRPKAPAAWRPGRSRLPTTIWGRHLYLAQHRGARLAHLPGRSGFRIPLLRRRRQRRRGQDLAGHPPRGGNAVRLT